MKKKNKTVSVLITATDYAKRHGITRIGTHDRIKTGKIRAVRIGGIWLVEDTIKTKN